MKKSLLFFILIVVLAGSVSAQCVPSCTNYAALPITFTTFPTNGNNQVAVQDYYPNGDDGYTAPVQLGFNFSYYCITYSTVLIYSNGLLQFNIGVPSTFPAGYDAAQLIPNPSMPTVLNGIVAFKMDDLDPSVGGSVSYTTMGTAPNRYFVLTYSNVPIYGQPSILNSGQIVLYETTNIIDIYTIDAPLSPNLATQGVENETGMYGTPVPGRNQSNWSATNSAWRFFPVSPAPPSSVTGSVMVCEGTQNIYTSASAASAISYTWSTPAGWTGTSSTTALTTTASASGNLSVSAVYTCGISAATTISVSVTPAPVVSIVLADPFVLCAGTAFSITPSGANNYTLYPGPVTGSGPGPIVVTGIASAIYTLVGSDATNCMSFNTATTEITVEQTPTVTVNSGSVCLGQSFTMLPQGANSYQVSSGFLTVTPNTPGVLNYSVTGVGTGSNQCLSLQPAIASLTVYANPSLDITTPRTLICKNETITLTATGADTYSWTNNGQTTPAISVAPAGNITYTVVGTTTAGCIANKAIGIVVAPCTGIDEAGSNVASVSVYPNPGSGVFKVIFDTSPAEVEAEVYNAVGELILTQQINEDTVEIDITSQAAGLYYLKLKGAGQQVLKLVKE